MPTRDWTLFFFVFYFDRKLFHSFLRPPHLRSTRMCSVYGLRSKHCSQIIWESFLYYSGSVQCCLFRLTNSYSSVSMFYFCCYTTYISHPHVFVHHTWCAIILPYASHRAKVMDNDCRVFYWLKRNLSIHNLLRVP